MISRHPDDLIESMRSETNEVEAAVDSALDNEAVEMTRQQREAFLYELQTWDRADIYADTFNVSAEDFREEMKRRGMDYSNPASRS